MTRVPTPTGVQRQRFTDALAQVYNNIGPDSGWVERAPSNAVFVDVLCDQVHHVTDYDGKPMLTAEELRLFSSLSRAQKRALCLEVGP